jgi:hypothetical protein
MNSKDSLRITLEDYFTEMFAGSKGLSHFHIISRIVYDILEIIEEETMEYELKIKIRGYKEEE